MTNKPSEVLEEMMERGWLADILYPLISWQREKEEAQTIGGLTWLIWLCQSWFHDRFILLRRRSRRC